MRATEERQLGWYALRALRNDCNRNLPRIPRQTTVNVDARCAFGQALRQFVELPANIGQVPKGLR
jgi:hypothetical protein